MSGAVDSAYGPNRDEDDIQSAEFESFCGDVSESAAWEAVREDLGAAGQLCVSVAYRSVNGEPVYLAEVAFEETEIGWVFSKR